MGCSKPTFSSPIEEAIKEVSKTKGKKVFWGVALTRRNSEVVDFTRSRVKNNFKLTNLMKIIRIEGYSGKKGRIQREIRKFMMFSLKLIKSDDKSMVEIGEIVFYER